MILENEIKLKANETSESFVASLVSSDFPSFIKQSSGRDRLQTITELLEQRKQKFIEFEHLINPERDDMESKYKEIAN